MKVARGAPEIAALTDDEIVVVNSADIVAHLEFRYPTNPSTPNRVLLAFLREAGNERSTGRHLH